jgi:hypothetical protein
MVRERTGIQVLQKIQENTLYLIDKNYRLMKTTMKITGNISLALLGVGTVFKIFHWPGAGVSLLLGFLLLCAIFFPSAVYLNYREREIKRLGLNLLILAGGIAFMTGVLFKVMHWPGAGILLFAGWSVILMLFLPLLLFVKLKEAPAGEQGMYVLGIASLMIFELSAMFKMFHWPGAGILMLLGSILLAGVFLPWFTWVKTKKAEMTTAQFIFLIITTMYAVALTALLSLNVSGPVMEHFTGNITESAQVVDYFEKKKQQVSLLNPSDAAQKSAEDISSKADELKNLIYAIKLNLVQSAEHTDKETAVKLIENPSLIKGKDNLETVRALMTDGELGKELREKIETYRETARRAVGSNSALHTGIGALLDTRTPDADNGHGSWEGSVFGNNMLISALAVLSEIEKNVRLVESVTLRQIRNQNI